MKKPKTFSLIAVASRYWKIIKMTLTDDRVPKLFKYGLIATMIYVISPIDIMPDMIPILGQIDDIGLVIVVLDWIKKNLPDIIIDEIDGKIIKGN